MTGMSKWVIVGSVVAMALASLSTLAIFVWMVFDSPVMSTGNTGWGMFDTRSLGEAWSGGWNSGPGMMGSSFGMDGDGMMSGHGIGGFLPSDSGGSEPMTLETVQARLEDYLRVRDGFELGEIMIFDNHAYAQIIEAETGIGALEVLIDPFTLSVTPEHGPTMMWNTKYGMHGGGMAGFFGGGNASEEMRVSEEAAIESLQAYLDDNNSGLQADEHAVAFYGYYTIHTLHNGEVVGMVSVNGSTGAVFPHTWHGTLLEMSVAEHD